MVAVVKDLVPTIREMGYRDVQDIVAIEGGTYSFPWTETIFRDCLLAGYVSVVLEHAGQTQGYAIMSLAAVEAHLLNLCVAERLRRLSVEKNVLHRHKLRPINEAYIFLFRRHEMGHLAKEMKDFDELVAG